ELILGVVEDERGVEVVKDGRKQIGLVGQEQLVLRHTCYRSGMRRLPLLLLLAALPLTAAAQQRVQVSLAPALAPAGAALNGRVFLYVAKAEPAGATPARNRRRANEPRFEIGDQVATQQFFGKDVLAW